MIDHTTKEAAVLLGVTPNAVRLYISRKQLSAYKRSGVDFIAQDELDRFKRERKRRGQPKKIVARDQEQKGKQ